MHLKLIVTISLWNMIMIIRSLIIAHVSWMLSSFGASRDDSLLEALFMIALYETMHNITNQMSEPCNYFCEL